MTEPFPFVFVLAVKHAVYSSKAERQRETILSLNRLYSSLMKNVSSKVRRQRGRVVRDPEIAGSSPSLTTSLNCFTVDPSSTPRPRL